MIDTLLHEMGHALGWPHVPLLDDADDYSNISDLMSGALPIWLDCDQYGYCDPDAVTYAGTAAINLYAVGWIDRAEVAEWQEGTETFRLGSLLSSQKTKMLVVPTPTRGTFYTVSVTPGAYDDAAARSVSVHYVEQPDPDDQFYQVELVLPPTRPDDLNPHLFPGDSMTIDSFTIKVVAEHGTSVSVELAGKAPGDPPPPPARFEDVPIQHTFHADIERLAASGVTRGCNPPRNDRFCPDDPVTRGQMAAFLTRALELETGTSSFADTAGHTFQADIAALADAGITKGCNPPDNTRFCPDQPVTRGQMAAFLVRALGLKPGEATFADTKGHVFAADIAALADAGITRGCNPPANDRFCPDDPVTRGQMAAFLVRTGLAR